MQSNFDVSMEKFICLFAPSKIRIIETQNGWSHRCLNAKWRFAQFTFYILNSFLKLERLECLFSFSTLLFIFDSISSCNSQTIWIRKTISLEKNQTCTSVGSGLFTQLFRHCLKTILEFELCQVHFPEMNDYQPNSA